MISDKASVALTATSNDVDFWAVSPREILWRCSYLDTSDYLIHTPFLFWLVRESRPRQIVTLGLENAVAHFALCQAVDKLGLGTLVYGIAPQFADQAAKPAAEQNAISQDIQDYNARNYPDFSRIYRAASNTAGDAFEDGSVDILLLDVALAPGVFDRLGQTWVDRLSDQGILILQGTNPAHLPDKAHDGFRALCSQFYHFQFPHGKGLTVFLKGTQHSDRIQALAAMEDSHEARRTHQQVFHRLGMAQLYEHMRQQSVGTKQQSDTELSRVKSTLSRTETALKNLQGEVDFVVVAHDKRSLALTRIYTQMFDLETVTKTLQIERDRAQKAQQALENAQADREAEFAALTAQIGIVRVERDAARIALRNTEDLLEEGKHTAVQTHEETLTKQQQAYDSIATERDTLKTQHDEAIKARNSARTERDALKAQHDEAIKARDNARAERDASKAQHDEAIKARDNALTEQDASKAQHDEAIKARNNALTERDASKAQHDEAIKARNNALTERDASKAQHDEAIKAHDNEIMKLRSALSISEEKIEEKQASYAMLQETALAQQAELLEQAAEVSGLRMDMKARFDELAHMTRDAVVAGEARDAAQAALDALQVRHEGLQASHASLQDSDLAQQTELLEQTAEISGLRVNMKARFDELAHMTRDAVAAGEARDAAQAALDALQVRHEGLQASHASLQAYDLAQQTELLEQTAEISGLRVNMKARFDELAHMTRDAVVAGEARDAAQAALDALQVRHEGLQASHASLQAYDLAQQTELLEQTAEISGLRVNMKARFDELAHMARDAVAAGEARDAAQAALDALQVRHEGLQASHASLQASDLAQQTELLEQTVSAKCAKAALDARFRELALITARTETLQARISRIQRQSDEGQALDLKRKETAWKNDHVLMQQEIDQSKIVFDKVIEDVTQRVKARDIKVTELSAALRQTRQDLKAAQEGLTVLTRERDGLEANIEELRNSSSWKLTEPLRGIRNKISK